MLDGGTGQMINTENESLEIQRHEEYVGNNESEATPSNVQNNEADVGLGSCRDGEVHENEKSSTSSSGNTRTSGRMRRVPDYYSPQDPFRADRDIDHALTALLADDWIPSPLVQVDTGRSSAQLKSNGLLCNATRIAPIIRDRQTRKGSDADKWTASRNKEREALDKNGTFLEETPGDGDLILPTKWHYTIKRDGQYKSRLVVCGNYDPFMGPTFAPTVSKCVMWLILAMTVVLFMHTRVIDISSAFVSQPIQRRVFVRIDGKIYRLLKYLYGLIDAPKGFNEGMSAHLVSGGYVRSVYDRCLFYKWESCTRFIYILVHVDDFHCSATSPELLDEFSNHLRCRYDITENDGNGYLGMEIESLPDGGKVFTRQKQLQALLDKWYPEDKRVTVAPQTPMSTAYEQSRQGEHVSVDITKYQSLLGGLMQLIDVRPDIIDAVSRVAQYVHECNEKDWMAMQRIVAYLYGTVSLGLVLRPGKMSSGRIFLLLRGYADAAYGCMKDGRSKLSFSFDLVSVPEVYTGERVDEGTGMFFTKSKICTEVNLLDVCPSQGC